jgi:hypothetical protein
MTEPKSQSALKPQKLYTHLEIEAPLCVWECLNEWILLEKADQYADWIALRNLTESLEEAAGFKTVSAVTPASG